MGFYKETANAELSLRNKCPPFLCLQKAVIQPPFSSQQSPNVDNTMFQDADHIPDEESSLAVGSRGRHISQRDVVVVVAGVLMVGLLIYLLPAAGNSQAQIGGQSCVEEQKALRKEEEVKVKALEAVIDRLKTELQTAKTHAPQPTKTSSTAQSKSKSNPQNKPSVAPPIPTPTPPTPTTPITTTTTPPATPSKKVKPRQISKGAKGAPTHLENPSVVIDIDYPQQGYLPLPINMFRKNFQGRSLPEVLYPTVELRKKREDFQGQRITFMNSKTYFPQVFLTKYNNPLTEAAEKEGREENEKEWVRLDKKFGLDKLTTELPMCIMVPGYNNNANYRIEYNLNSIFSQNYSNYKVVLIDDMSNDGSGVVYRNYFSFHRIDKERYTYIENSKRVTALQNIYMASLNHCSEDSIVVTIDADDEFIGRNVLNVFNWGYQTKKAGVLYTNFMRYQQGITLQNGFTSDYSDQIKKENHFRYKTMLFSHLRSYRNELIAMIDPKDLQDDEGAFFTITYDFALFIPLMELSCGRVNKIDGEYHYLYNTGTGLNDYNNRDRQVQVEKKIRGRKRYECNKDFDRRMSK